MDRSRRNHTKRAATSPVDSFWAATLEKKKDWKKRPQPLRRVPRTSERDLKTQSAEVVDVHALARPTPRERVSKSRPEVLDVTVNRRGKSLVFTDRKYKRKGSMDVGEENHSEEGNHSETSDIHGTEKTFLVSPEMASAKSRGEE